MPPLNGFLPQARPRRPVHASPSPVSHHLLLGSPCSRDPSLHHSSAPISPAPPTPTRGSLASRLHPLRWSVLSQAFLDKPIWNPSSSPSHSNPGAGKPQPEGQTDLLHFSESSFTSTRPHSSVSLLSVAASTLWRQDCTRAMETFGTTEPRTFTRRPLTEKVCQAGLQPTALPDSSSSPKSDLLPTPL